MSKLIVANWKLNPLTASEAQTLAESINPISKHEVVLCPPMAFLNLVKYHNLGAQDCSVEIKGAYTGQVSAAQLASIGIDYCIVGHSERRMGQGETDALINQKIKTLLEYKITPILCIGYGTTVEQDELEVVDVLKQQIIDGLAEVDPKKVVVAYEPVWAIGTKKAASPEHAEQIALYLKTKHQVGKVLYGGSVNSTNAQSFFEQHHVDGALIGGASLLADDFNKIIEL
ncbi:MAG: triose-phosphate isomerase [Candidatus Doudnabacteria bacterium]